MSSQEAHCGHPAERFHSKRDPQGEADRYLEAIAAGKRPSALVCIAPGMDWLSLAAERRWPGIRTVSLQSDPTLRGLEQPSPALRWYPDSGPELAAFLIGALRDTVDGGLLLAEWRPALAAAPAFGAKVRSALKEALAFLSAAGASERYWAGRWLKNAVRNFLLLDRITSLAPDERPLLLAAAGPSLEPCLDALKTLTGRIRVWSLASAAAACEARGFEPELLVATDGGAWNLLHYPASALSKPVASPLSGRLGAQWLEEGLFVPLDLGSVREADLLRALGVAAPPAAPHGTAAGTAISLAASLGARTIIVAGMDLGAHDLNEHARPYAFEDRECRASNRLRPAHASAFARVAERYPFFAEGRWRASRAFSAYASAGFGASEAFSVSPSPFASDLRHIDLESARRMLEPNAEGRGKRPLCSTALKISRREREDALAGLVDTWIQTSERGMAHALKGARLDAEVKDFLLALAPQTSAPFIAECARGTADADLARAALDALKAGAAELLEELGL